MEPKMKLFDFGAFQNKMQMPSHDKILFHVLLGHFILIPVRTWILDPKLTPPHYPLLANYGKLMQKFFWNFHFAGRHTGRFTGKLIHSIFFDWNHIWYVTFGLDEFSSKRSSSRPGFSKNWMVPMIFWWMSFPVKRSQKFPRNLPIRVKEAYISNSTFHMVSIFTNIFKVWCVFPMIIWPDSRMGQYKGGDHTLRVRLFGCNFWALEILF